MSEIEHMKTSPYLTDVMVFCDEGDTLNFLYLLEDHDKQGLRGEKQYRPRGSL